MAKRRKPYIYEYVKVLRVIDGDTFDADIDMGGKHHQLSPVRLKGINSPEMSSKIPEVLLEAKAAKAYLESLLPVGTMVKIQSTRLDKYGRYESIVTNEAGEIINDLVLNSGNAKKALTDEL